MDIANSIPTNIKRVLTEFVESCRNSFKDDLIAVVLYGSAAEGRLRPTSDVNLVVVLSSFDQGKADGLREPLRLARVAIRLTAMFLLESELQEAASAFAVKFADISQRHQVLYGADPFAHIIVSRQDSILRLKQTLLNLILRLRESYINRGLREEQLAILIADTAGPLRSCARTLLELEGAPPKSPKEALEYLATAIQGSSAVPIELSRVSEARENEILAPGVAAPTIFYIIDLARAMYRRASSCS